MAIVAENEGKVTELRETGEQEVVETQSIACPECDKDVSQKID
jgi:hypothetical protein